MTRLVTIKHDHLEFVRELGERFPDLPDGEVINAAEEYIGEKLNHQLQNAMMYEYLNRGKGKNPWLM